MKLSKNYCLPFPEYGKYTLIVVGVGGTGSHLSYDMARLISHGRSLGTEIELLLIDPDIVEEKNVGRQRFTRAEIGMNKAHARAISLSRWLGIKVQFVDGRFSADCIPGQPYSRRGKNFAILLGCLDDSFGNAGRQAIATSMQKDKQRYLDLIWIDAGNDRYSGQVAVGDMLSGGSIVLNRQMGLVDRLPAPCVSIAGLLDAPEESFLDSELGCAELTAAGEQSLFINSMMAGIMSQFVFDIIFRRRLEALATFVNLSPAPTVQSVFINDESLAKYGHGIEIKEQ